MPTTIVLPLQLRISYELFIGRAYFFKDNKFLPFNTNNIDILLRGLTGYFFNVVQCPIAKVLSYNFPKFVPILIKLLYNRLAELFNLPIITAISITKYLSYVYFIMYIHIQFQKMTDRTALTNDVQIYV